MDYRIHDTLILIFGHVGEGNSFAKKKKNWGIIKKKKLICISSAKYCLYFQFRGTNFTSS